MNASSLKIHWKIWCHSWRPPWGMPIPCKSKQCSFPSMTTNLKVPKASKWRCRCQNVARHQPTTTPPGTKNVTEPVIETVAWVMIMKRQGAASWIMANKCHWTKHQNIPYWNGPWKSRRRPAMIWRQSTMKQTRASLTKRKSWRVYGIMIEIEEGENKVAGFIVEMKKCRERLN